MASYTKQRVLAACAALSLFIPSQSVASSPSDYQSGVSAYKAHDFKTAAQYLRRASQQSSNPALLLYLGHACFGSADKTGALAAYQQLANKYPNTPEAQQAISCIARIDPSAAKSVSKPAALPSQSNALPTQSNASQIQSTTLPINSSGASRRWTPQSMPLKIYVSNGLELPAALAGRVLSKEEFRSLSDSFKNRAFMRGLRTNARYTSDTGAAVNAGLEIWNCVPDVLRFTTTQNAAEADILIFFFDILSEDRSGFCLYPYLAGQPNIIEIAMEKKDSKYNKDVWARIIRGVTAHELGHAFGLDHSADKSDMMYDHEILAYDPAGNIVETRQLTEADKASLRALYNKPAKYLMVSVKSRR